MKDATLFISLFHRRTTPDERLNGWGPAGPIINPVEISFTYGNIKIHDRWDDHFEELPIIDGLVFYDGHYYADFEVWTADDPLLQAEPDRPRHDAQTFFRIIKNQNHHV